MQTPSRNNQLQMFPGGEDLPLWSGTRPLATLKALPTSRKVKKLHELYAGPEDNASRALREAAQMEPPSARLQKSGAIGLTSADLISVILGTSKIPELAARLLIQTNGISKMSSFSVGELASLVDGMTTERACRLVAAFALAKRASMPVEWNPVIKSPQDIAMILNDMAALEQEQMRVLLLNTKNVLIQSVTVYQGSVHTTVIRINELFSAAIRMKASAIVVAHNHPSGDPTPSPEDIAVTRQINAAANLLDIDLLDHVVIGSQGRYVSLKERGVGFGG